MLLTVFVDYYTSPTENVYLCFPDSPAIYMQPVGHETHMAAIPLSVSGTPIELSYRFEVRDNDGTVRSEYGHPHSLVVDSHVDELSVYDHWHDMPSHAENSSKFISRIINRHATTESQPLSSNTLSFSIAAPGLPTDVQLFVVGDIPILGTWNPDNAIPLTTADGTTYSVSIPLPLPSTVFNYKFITRNSKGDIQWEEDDNRSFAVPKDTLQDTAIVIAGLTLRIPTAKFHAVGTVIPVFSLRSENSFGIGDFADLASMSEWVAETGQNILQILPVNDTTMTGKWTDSYPYNAISTFALHPLYLRLQVPDYSPELAKKFKNVQKRLNALPYLDYEKVFKAKMEFAKADYNHHGAEILSSVQFHDFALKNKNWLDDYVAFSLLRDKFGTADFSQWGEYSTYSKENVEKFLSENTIHADFYRYLQFLLHLQLKHASETAETLGVGLKGDIPIGISRNSVDAWTNPSLFNLDMCAGAPPDDFAVNGQNWGFPTYNWENMALDGFQWWKNRFKKLAEYFHAYRIDHILGFFRIWQIPEKQLYGTLGTFYPALPLSSDEMLRKFGFELKPSYILDPTLSQREILRKFERRPKTKANTKALKDELDKAADILFIEDVHQPGLYHPRIDAHKTGMFSSLDPDAQKAFLNLYEDYYYHRHNDFWHDSAMRKLPELISTTDMLCCGEDLGMIPQCVAPVMDTLSILSLEVQRMPKQFGVEFANPALYPYLAVATTSTHDMPGLRFWLNENPHRTERLLNTMGQSNLPIGDSPETCSAIIKSHLKSPSMLCVLPWQDWMSIDASLRLDNPADETINNPACSNHYWRYRMHLTIEQLRNSAKLTESIRKLIAG